MAIWDDLLPGERLAYTYLESLAEKGVSANQALQTLSEAGLGVRRSTGLSLYSAIQSNISARSYISNVRNDYLPNPARLPTSITSQLRAYSYKVAVEGINLATGEITKRYVTVSSNDLLTKNQALDEANGYIDGDTTKYGIAPTSLQVEAVTVSPDAAIPF